MKKKYLNHLGKVWLNVASSVYVLPDFVNLDNHIYLKFRPILPLLIKVLSPGHASWAKEYLKASSAAVLVQHDCRKKLKFPDNSVDHILCSHFLEHVYLEEMKTIVSDFHRVLKPGGTLHIIVPDLNVFIEKYHTMKMEGNSLAADEFINNTLLSRPTRGSLRYRLMEMHGGFGLQHRWMYDEAALLHHVAQLGFEINNQMDVPSREFRKGDDSIHIRAVKN